MTKFNLRNIALEKGYILNYTEDILKTTIQSFKNSEMKSPKF